MGSSYIIAAFLCLLLSGCVKSAPDEIDLQNAQTLCKGHGGVLKVSPESDGLRVVCKDNLQLLVVDTNPHDNMIVLLMMINQ